jgi:Ion channel
MVPVTITVWITLEITGFALFYYAGMSEKTFKFSSLGLEPSFSDALYVSGTSISTAGFGDVTPVSGVYQALTVSEALIGFGILTLAVTYVIGVYGILQQLGVLAAGLFHQASDTGDPLSILVPHFPGGEPRELETHIMTLHRGLVEIYEGVRRYPIVYYYHSRRAYRFFPYTFRMMGGMAAALR